MVGKQKFKTRMVELKVQERVDYCIPSVLQTIFGNKGIRMTQDGIAGSLTNCNSGGFMFYDRNTEGFFRSLGLDHSFYWIDQVPFNEPDDLLKQMRPGFGFIGYQKHAHLFDGFDGVNTWLIDPMDGERIAKSYGKLVSLMRRSNDGCFLNFEGSDTSGRV